jgi:hypothetical protein
MGSGSIASGIFLISALNGDEWPDSPLCSFTPKDISMRIEDESK